jgi:hypothetical protein
MGEGESPRRRDVLRASAVGGLVAFGWSAGDVSGAERTGAAADQETTQQATEGGESAYAFSYDLQEGDRFRVQSRLRTSEGDPATEMIPATCLDGGAQEFPAFVVRAYRGDLQLGYEGLFVPQQAPEAGSGGTTTTTETSEADETTTTETITTTETTTTDTVNETDTPTETLEPVNETDTPTETLEPANETNAANETTTTTTEAAIQDATTTETTESETETTTDTETTPDGETDTTATETEETTTETEETTTETTETATPATETTPDGADGLPEIRVGEWYRVASMSKCDSLSRLSLEAAEARTTAE